MNGAGSHFHMLWCFAPYYHVNKSWLCWACSSRARMLANWVQRHANMQHRSSFVFIKSVMSSDTTYLLSESFLLGSSPKLMNLKCFDDNTCDWNILLKSLLQILSINQGNSPDIHWYYELKILGLWYALFCKIQKKQCFWFEVLHQLSNRSDLTDNCSKIVPDWVRCFRNPICPFCCGI